MSDFVELEYKYKADDVSFLKFRELMEGLQLVKQKDISSWDYYFTPVNNDYEGFVRFRNSSISPELTKKIKTKNDNNFNRIEIDLPLDRTKVTVPIVDKFMETLNHKENFRIFKSCFIYWLDTVNFVYYIVFDQNLKEVGRFIEVEVNKDKVASLKDKGDHLRTGAEYELLKYERELETIGIKSSNRMKKSLFELFKK